ncbi:MAG: type restriction enzyme subunit [Acidobacteriota bacterium]|jgi:type I restriction enzyme S subunit|nr:type restriction enzyme subunit [Acidobacteriota bacterium]
MSELWSKAKLGDLLRRVERFEPRDELTEYSFAGTYSFARGIFVGERKLGSTFALPKVQRIRVGDFIYCKIMAWEGAFGFAPQEADNCVMSGAFVVYEVNRRRIEEKYLDYFFKVPAHWKSIGSHSTGTNVRRQSLHPALFERTEILLPPLAEQRLIVARIDELAAQIHEASAVRYQAAKEAEALLNAETSRIFETLLHGERLPIRTLGCAGENPIQIGPFGAQLQKAEFVDNGIPVLNVGNVWPDGLRLDSLNHVTDEKAQELRRYSLRTGDLLFARSGATLGKVCLVPEECDSWLMTGHLFRVRFDPNRVINRFAFAAFRGSLQIREQVFGQIRGGTRPGYNTTLLGSVELPVPSLPVQRRIVRELDALQAEVDALKRLQSETAAELDALLPSILDRAFKGEL